MNGRSFLLAALYLAGCGGRATERTAEPPNIVIILTDDQRADSLGIAGHSFVPTPNLDRIAREGAAFDNAFVVTAVCCPSRATLLTGLPPHRTGVSDNGHDLDYLGTPTLAQTLRQAGYATAFVGKYHLGADGARRPGFDYWVAYDNNGAHGTYVDSPLVVGDGEVASTGYSTEVLTDLAVGWLRGRGGGPFLLLLSLKSPHVPLTPAPQDRQLFRDVRPPIPASFADPYEALPEVLRDATTLREARSLRREGVPDEGALAEILREYARMIPSIDRAAGRIYDVLAEMGVLDRTLLIFTSDNGRLLGEHGLLRKRLPYDPSVRVPLLLRWPELIEPGLRLEQQALNADLAPTILEAAGLEVAPGLPGRSLLALFRDPAAAWREDWLYIGDFARGERPFCLAVRERRWKYVRYPAAEQLFDLHADPDERRDLSAEPAHAEELARLRARMRQLMAAEQVPPEWWEPG